MHDLTDEATKDKELLKNRLSINAVDGKNKLDLVMTSVIILAIVASIMYESIVILEKKIVK